MKQNKKSLTYVGMGIIGVSILISLWLFISNMVQSSAAPTDYTVDGSGILTGYTGGGGVINDIPGNVLTVSGAFSGNAAITDITLPASVTTIAENAFSGCSGLQSVDLSATRITTIPAGLFSNCGVLGQVRLPATVTNINPSAFSDCGNLANISFAGGSFSYSDGVVYNGSNTIHLVLPYAGNSGQFVVPSTVTNIGVDAFSYSGITNFRIHENISVFGAQSYWERGAEHIEIYGYYNTPVSAYVETLEKGFVTLHVIGGGDPPPLDPDDGGGSGGGGGSSGGGGGGNSGNNNNNNNNQTTTPPAVQPDNNNNNSGNTNGNANPNGNSNAGVSGNKDQTPKTADGDLDPRWFLIMGMLMSGVAMIFYSRGRRFEYSSRRKDSDLDS